MIRNIEVKTHEPNVLFADTIVYDQRPEWCKATARQLCMSMLRPRQNYSYDLEYHKLPVVIFLCGGSFAHMDRNTWMPEMLFLAKRGYAVVGVEYSTNIWSGFPAQLEDVKCAVRFLRTHADKLDIDPTRIAVMGESAGAYLATMMGVTNADPRFDKGTYLDESSEVQLVIPWYPPVDFKELGKNKRTDRPSSNQVFDDPREYIRCAEHLPPFLILHGDEDNEVPFFHGRMLYDALEQEGSDVDLCVIKGGNHGSYHFVQPDVKKIIADYLDAHFKPLDP